MMGRERKTFDTAPFIKAIRDSGLSQSEIARRIAAAEGTTPSSELRLIQRMLNGNTERLWPQTAKRYVRLFAD